MRSELRCMDAKLAMPLQAACVAGGQQSCADVGHRAGCCAGANCPEPGGRKSGRSAAVAAHPSRHRATSRRTPQQGQNGRAALPHCRVCAARGPPASAASSAPPRGAARAGAGLA